SSLFQRLFQFLKCTTPTHIIIMESRPRVNIRLLKEHGRSALSGRKLQGDQLIHFWLIGPTPGENKSVWRIDFLIDSMTSEFRAIRIDEGHGKSTIDPHVKFRFQHFSIWIRTKPQLRNGWICPCLPNLGRRMREFPCDLYRSLHRSQVQVVLLNSDKRRRNIGSRMDFASSLLAPRKVTNRANPRANASAKASSL